jgi:spore germination cell wall hydrolase CwlJ-like protein
MTDAVLLLRRFVLALCVWREARGESFRGKSLVAQVIENRVRDPRWPDTYVGVITQRLQFSAFNAGDPNALMFPAENDRAWPDCVAAADLVVAAPALLTTANHYHTVDVRPTWADPTRLVTQEGRHKFYEL